MSRRPVPDRAERLVLALCRAVERVHAGRALRWASVRDVSAELPTVTLEQLEAAIAVAAERGWLEAAGRPAHSVILKAAGRGALAPASTRSGGRRRRS